MDYHTTTHHDGPPHTAGQAHDAPSAVADAADPVQCAIQASTVVLVEGADLQAQWA